MSSKEELQQRFNKANLSKHSNLFTQTRVFQELIMFMDYKIRNQIKTFTLLSLCGGERTKFMVDIYFQKAFTNLNLVEKVELYEKTIQYAIQLQSVQSQLKQSVIDINVEDDSDNIIMKKQSMRFRVQVEKGFHSWNQIYLDLDGFKVSSEEMQFDLRNYILRKSKKTDKQCYVLQAIHQTQPQVLRFCFLTNNDFKKYLPIIKDLIDKGYKQMIKRMYNIQIKINSNIVKPQPSKEKSLLINSVSKNLKGEQENHIQQCHEVSHIVEEVLKQPEQQNLSLQLNQIIANDNQMFQQMELITKIKHKQPIQIFHKNIFSIMFSSFDLSQMDHFEQYKVVSNNQLGNCVIFQNSSNPLLFKLQLFLSLNPVLTLEVLTNLSLFKHWHPQIIQGQIKLSISSQNCAICYQTHRAYSQWYRERDFLYLRHVFKLDQNYFIADRSIENTNFIPLDTIHRGKIVYQIIKISPCTTGSKLIIQCHFQHGGLLNRNHAKDLSNRYLCGFQRIQSYFKNTDVQSKLKKYFNSGWKIKQIPTLQSFKYIKSKQDTQLHDSQFNDEKVSKIDQEDVFFSIKEDQDQDFQRKSVHQINEKELAEKKMEILPDIPYSIQTNEEGFVILPKQYLKVRHPTGIINTAERKRINPVFADFLLKDIWKLQENGGLLLINKKLMSAQDSVLSFIMSTLKKNIFSGKGGLNISLPVTIFNSDSNLSRFCLAMGNAPEFIEQAAQLTDPIQRMKLCMIFGLTNSLLFVDMEKPFNPILGQTYQCFIAGCPVYAEQISHHPPISALLMYGRGYRIHATLEATANIHLNSADGINIGWYRIVFDDGQEICFQTPPAEFSGFAIGDRKFYFTKKGYYFDMNNNLFAEMNFQDNSGLFSGKKWKYKDQIQAEILTVKSDFLSKFVTNFTDKKHSPSSSDILDRHAKLEGRWTHSLSWNGVKVYSVNQNLPFQVVQYQYPLPSNSKYREDLYYRKHNDLARSQIEKQRLENIQRGDRKERAKYSGKKH